MAPTTHIKENAMRSGQLLVCSLALLASAACRENPLVPDGNVMPVANAGLDQRLDYAGVPVTVTLDASGSIDADGSIVTYRWLSAAEVPDGGMGGRRTPPEAPAGWPDDVVNPTVVLDQGVWRFSLWVIDDRGAVSQPDTVEVQVGADPVAQCVDSVYSGVAEACAMCLCSIDDMCRAAAVESACDEPCWGLLRCLGVNCPDFTAMAAMGDTSCLTTNCLAEYTAYTGGSTPMGATAVGMCIRTSCPTECASM